MAERRNIFAGFGKRSDMLVAVGVVAVMLMLLIPLPTVLLDLLMSLNLVISLLTILIVLYTRNALEFSVFPTVLLVLTVFGLALNISSTRLILAQGGEFSGRIIRAFSQFVVGTSGAQGLVIGVIIFIILVAVQFIVITKGSTRVAEVAARFTLDALPGKQMAIEAEYNSGVITEEEAHVRKNSLEREVDFYGAMDGASKFVSGNVKVGVLITMVNIIGGIIVGVTIHGESFSAALNNYFALAVGDGLVTQFPALLISTATGIIVTRAISDGTFGEDITAQFSNQSRIYMIAALFLVVLGFLPGFPWYLLLPMGGLAGFMALQLRRKQRRTEKQQAERAAPQAQRAAEQEAEISPIAPLDPLSLELGYSLVPLVDKESGAELLDRIIRIRKEVALDLGLVVPRIRIVDNLRLTPTAYSFKLKGIEVGSGTIEMNRYLCIGNGAIDSDIPGEDTVDPTFGLPARWIQEEYRERAERSGFTVVDSPSIIATHLTELIKRNAADILGRQEVRKMLDALKKDYPAVTEDVQKALSVGEIQKVLQGLLRERVSIRNLVRILETAADYGEISKKAEFLIEKCRQALKLQLSQQYATAEHAISVITVAPELEKQIIESVSESPEGAIVALPPAIYRRLIDSARAVITRVQQQGHTPIVLTSEAARLPTKQLTERTFPQLVILSVLEIAPSTTVNAVAVISAAHAVEVG